MSTLTYAGPVASEKQISFVTDLIAKREVAADVASKITELITLGTYTKAQASDDIGAFLRLPKRAAVAATAKPNAMQSLLSSVPKSKYAIPVEELEFTDADDVFNGDLVFIELKEYMNTLYVRRLHGSPGLFTRSKMSITSVKAAIAIIAADPYKYAKLFGDNYTCCGSCGAELTDPRSRELMLGPECKKKFGF